MSTSVTSDVEEARAAATDAATPTVWRPAAVVGLAAAAIRVVWVLIASRPPQGLSDPFIYLRAAESIARGDGYASLLGEPTAYYPPGYPFFLGAVHWLLDLAGGGEHLVMVVGLVQALLGGVAAGAIVLTGQRLRRGPAGTHLGVVAGVLFALWPNLVLHTPLILSESLFLATSCVLLAALATWLCRTGGWRDSPWTAAVVVLATAASTLVRPQSILLLVPGAAFACWVAYRGRTGVGRVVVRAVLPVIVGVLVAVVPWSIRNAVVMDAFVPLSTNTGDNLCIGYYDGATGGFAITEDCATEGGYVDGPAVEVERDSELRDRALSWIAQNPTRVPGLAWDKFVVTFSADHDALRAWESYEEDPHLTSAARTTLRTLSDVYYWIVAVASVLGVAAVAAAAWRRREAGIGGDAAPALAVQVLVATVWLAALAVPMLFFGDQRFKVPIAPAACLMAATATIALLDAARRRDTVDDVSHDEEPLDEEVPSL